MAMRGGARLICSRLLGNVSLQSRCFASEVPAAGSGKAVTRINNQVEPEGVEALDGRPVERHTLSIAVDVPDDISFISGVPEEHIKGRKVTIKRPTKNAMQSGTANQQKWIMKWDTQERWENPLMGWTSTADPLSNLEVSFPDKESAIALCEKNGWPYELQDPPVKPPRHKSYAGNFAWNKRTRRSCK